MSNKNYGIKKGIFVLLVMFSGIATICAKESTASCVYKWAWNNNNYTYAVDVSFDPNTKTGSVSSVKSVGSGSDAYTMYKIGDLQLKNFTVNNETKLKCPSNLYVVYDNVSFKIYAQKDNQSGDFLSDMQGSTWWVSPNDASASKVVNTAVTTNDEFFTCTLSGTIGDDLNIKTDVKINKTQKKVTINSTKPSSITYTFDTNSTILNSYDSCPSKIYYKCHLLTGKCTVHSSMVSGAYEFSYASVQTPDADKIIDDTKEERPNFKFEYEGELDCNSIKELIDWLQGVLTFLQYGVILLVVVLSMLEYTKAVTSGDADVMKKANKKTIKRVIVIVVLLLVGPVLNLILDIFIGGKISICGLK